MARYRKDTPTNLTISVNFNGTGMGELHSQGTIEPTNRKQVQSAIRESLQNYIRIIKLNPNEYDKNTFFLDMMRKLNDAHDNETDKNVFDFDDITYIWRTDSTDEHAKPFSTAPQEVKERIAVACNMSIEEIQAELDSMTSDDEDERIWSRFEEPKFPLGYYIDEVNKTGFIDFFPNRGIEIYSPDGNTTLVINDFGEVPNGYDTEAINMLYDGWEMCRYTDQYDISYYENMYETTEPYSAREIMQTFASNAEQLMAVLSIVDAGDIFRELGGKELDSQTLTKTQTRTFIKDEFKPSKKENKLLDNNNLTSDMFEQKSVTYEDSYRLLKLDGSIFTQNVVDKTSLTTDSNRPVYAVHCQCTSTDRDFYLFVENEVAERNYDAIECIASTLRMVDEVTGNEIPLTKEDYLKIEAES